MYSSRRGRLGVLRQHVSILAICSAVVIVVAIITGFFAAPQEAYAWMTDDGTNWRSTSAYEFGTYDWQNTGSTLPSDLRSSQLAIIGNYIYLFAGFNGSDAIDTIFRAPLSDPTSWSDTGANLPGDSFGSKLAIIGDYVYLFGGYNGIVTKDIYRAPTSNPTSWVDTGANMPVYPNRGQLAIIGDYVYLFSGFNGSFVKDIYRAPLSNPTSWTNTGSDTPRVVYNSQLAIIGDYVYLFGGFDGQTGSLDYMKDIYRAPLSNPLTWTDTGADLPGILYDSQLAIIGDYVYLFGGVDGISYTNASDAIYRAPLSNPLSWTDTGAKLPGEVYASQLAIIGDYAYLFGGHNGSSAVNVIYRSLLSASVPGTPGTPTFTNVSTSSMTVNWTAASGADSYKVERCEGVSCSSFAEIASGVTDLFLNDTGLTPNTSYSYRVRGTNTAGDGPYSGTGTQVTDAAADCLFNETTVPDGDSVTAYEEGVVPYGESCVSEQRTCTNGVLSGSYAYDSCSVAPPPPSGTALEGYAWSETIGWLSLNGTTYGLYIDDDGLLAGYAWSENIGWVSAYSSDLTGCPQSPCSAYMSSEKLDGWLKALAANDAESGGWDGWIALGDMNEADGIDYGVTLSSGAYSGFAWGDMNVGWLDFGYATTEYEACTASYQCNDVTHYDNLCTPSINENTECSPGLVCAPGAVPCVLPPDPSGDLWLVPVLVPTGDTTLVSWNVADTSSCRVFGENGDEWFGGGSGSETSSGIIQTTLFTLECADELNTATTTVDTAYAVVVPTWVER